MRRQFYGMKRANGDAGDGRRRTPRCLLAWRDGAFTFTARDAVPSGASGVGMR